jgi:hypothetical protein
MFQSQRRSNHQLESINKGITPLLGNTPTRVTPSTLPVPVEKIKQEQGICGIANIPNQVHFVTSHDHINFNVLLMGTLHQPLIIESRQGKGLFLSLTTAISCSYHWE